MGGDIGIAGKDDLEGEINNSDDGEDANELTDGIFNLLSGGAGSARFDGDDGVGGGGGEEFFRVHRLLGLRY